MENSLARMKQEGSDTIIED